jgi:serine/threonine protein kinase
VKPADKRVPGASPEDSSDEGLLTSEDLFGDLVDAPVATPRSEPRAARREPIKIQVAEPAAPRIGAESPPRVEPLPAEVAALLDAFSAPAEEAARAEAIRGEQASASPDNPRTREIPRIEEQPAIAEPAPARVSAPAPIVEPEPAAEAPLEPPALEPEQAPPPRAPTTKETRRIITGVLPENLDALIDNALLPATTREAAERAGLDASPAAWAEPEEEASEEPSETLSPRLEDDIAPEPVSAALAAEPDLEELPAPSSRTGTKFQAAAAQPGAAPGSGIDLAALAEDAIDSAPTPEPMPAPPPPLSNLTPPPGPGPAYGPYRLLEKLAVGGMAEVFKGKRSGVEGFEKVVAVKKILPHLSDNKEFVDMFIDEAKMVVGLTHPNIVQIFDLGRIDKSYYIAMEYVHGRDLRSILRRTRERGALIPLPLCLRIAIMVSAALGYAHRKKDDRGRAMKIVHRDISPQNILISFEGDVKLTDFGIAKAATKASSTDRGALRGKLLYMSPEQAWGKAIDRRSDLFSLGIVLYEMVTDQKPFLAASEMSVLEMVRECRVVAPSSVNATVPQSLERVIMKALDRDPERRYQSAAEMIKDLERVQTGRPAPATAADLARYMEQLFDRDERGAPVAEEGASGEHRSSPTGEETGSAPASTDAAPAEGPRESMSIQKLLRRFGIK